MFFIFGISIAFFLGLVLIGKRRKTVSDIILACWLFFIGLHLLLYYLLISGRSFEFPFLLGIDRPLPLVHGPFLFLYTASLTNPRLLKKPFWLLHFIPAIACWTYMAKFYARSAAEKIFVYQHQGQGYKTFMIIAISAIILSGVFYIVASFVLLSRHRQRILHQFSSTEKINLRWLQYLLYGLSVVWVFVTFGDDTLTFASSVAFVLFIGYFGIRQTSVFSPPGKDPLPETSRKNHFYKKTAGAYSIIRENESDRLSAGVEWPAKIPPVANGSPARLIMDGGFQSGDKQKYAKSGLSSEMEETVQRELDRLMHVEKLYTDSELSLSSLAKKLDIHPNYLSQVINERGQNFYDYINALRVDAFKEMLTDPENQKFTILSMAFECGFNSKSSFNRHFRKATGQSPSVYLRLLTENASLQA